MPRILPLTAPDVLGTPLPSLRVGSVHTTSSALHRVNFVGRLREWTNFRQDAIARVSSNVRWSRRTIDVAMIGQGAENSVSREQLVLGDEHGLQGRLNERLCRAVTSCLQAQGFNIRAGDFKAAVSTANNAPPRVPDAVMINANAAIKLIGKLKTPWARDHIRMMKEGLRLFEKGDERTLRRILGQVARYMHDENVIYGFLSTYNETIFLRKVDIQGVWTLEYSPVITHNNEYDPQRGTITTRQGLFHLAVLAETAPAFGKNLPGNQNQRWTN